jgi:hypothetical protein
MTMLNHTYFDTAGKRDHTIIGSGDYSGRKAHVFEEPDGSYTVVMINDAAVSKQQSFTDVSKHYAISVAENWVLGIIK